MNGGREQGFSLVELLIVIGLLGTLTGVVMLSLEAFDAGVREAAQDIDTVGAVVACDAASNDLLVVAACAGPAAPPAPPTPSLTGTVTITTDDDGENGLSTVGEGLLLALAVIDAEGEALAGSFVRVEVFDGADASAPLQSSDVAPATDSQGRSSVVVTRQDPGLLTVRACIGTSSAPPGACTEPATSTSDAFVREFASRPRVIYWNRDDSDSALRVIWDTAVTPVATTTPQRYLVYESSQACVTGEPPLAVGTARLLASSNATTTLRVELSDSVLASGQMENRRLRIEAAAEGTLPEEGGLANRATTCLPFGDVPVASMINLTPSSGSSETGTPVTLTATVLDAEGRPFTGATLRYEVVSDGDSPRLVGSPPVTDADGRTAFTFSRPVAGSDQIRVCTQPTGAMPSTCATGTGPAATASRTWTETVAPVVKPTVLTWERVANDAIQVTWNTDVDRSAAPPPSHYRIYASPEDCTARGPVAAAGNDRQIVPGTGGTTVHITFPGNVVQQVRMDQRRLSVAVDTERNVNGTGNDAIDCSVPDAAVAATLLLEPSSGATRTGTDASLTATLVASDGAPYVGASVRFEARGTSDIVFGPSTTDGNGQATATYRRDTEGEDEIVACVDADGQAPTSCVTATGPTGAATWTWFTTPPRPEVVTWRRVNNSSIQVVWNTDVSGSDPAPGHYRMFDTSGTCPDGATLSGGTGISRQLVAGSGGTTVLITFGGNVSQQNFLDRRRLQVDEGAERNGDGVANHAADCVPFTP